MGSEVAQLQKFFSEHSLVYMLYIWHSGCIMKPTRKWYFLPFLCLKIVFVVIFAQICPKSVKIWMVDITFFVFVVSRDWRYMLEGYYYTFKKLKKNWSWPTSVGPAYHLKIQNNEKQIFFFIVLNFEGYAYPTEVGQLQFFLNFLKV